MAYGIRLTESVNRAIQNAGKIALLYGNYQIGTEHMLYGLGSVKDSVASKILTNFGVNHNKIDDIIIVANDEWQAAIVDNMSRAGNHHI